MKKQEFLNDVMHEINSLKKNAEKNELDALCFEEFDQYTGTGCIYGQMTGSCDSARAAELMQKSCVRVIDLQIIDDLPGFKYIVNSTFSTIKPIINGPFNMSRWEASKGRTQEFVSALETYICMRGAKNEQIIRYLKGEQRTLKL